MTKIMEQLSTPLVSPLENQIKIIEGQFLICRSVQMHEHNLFNLDSSLFSFHRICTSKLFDKLFRKMKMIIVREFL